MVKLQAFGVGMYDGYFFLSNLNILIKEFNILIKELKEHSVEKSMKYGTKVIKMSNEN